MSEDLKPNVTVKPINWKGSEGCRYFFFLGHAWLVTERDGKWQFTVSEKQGPIGEPESTHDSEDEAVQAALDHFLDTLLSQITTQPVGVAEAARVLLEAEVYPEQYATYGNDRTDRYAKGFCGGVEAFKDALRALTKGGE